MKLKPLVSCLCVSTDRPSFLSKTIESFDHQTYPNKELIIVSAAYDAVYESLISAKSTGQIKYYWPDQKATITLGELRNLAIDKCEGDFFCVWDDDDWYHCKRIELQLTDVLRSKKAGSITPFYLLYDRVNLKAYMSVPIPLPASLLCRKNSLAPQLRYKDLPKSEDDTFIFDLNQQNILFPTINPVIYIYVYHGNNTWGNNHFLKFCAKEFSCEATSLIGDVVSGKYSCQEGSKILDSARILEEFDYFSTFTFHSTAVAIDLTTPYFQP